jgi:chorismate mutase/prephenate dehydratase
MSEHRQPSSASVAAGDAGRAPLARLREAIDAVDRVILAQLNERARLVQEVGRIKAGEGTPVYDPSRERAIVRRLAEGNPGPFPVAALAPVFREIISATRSLEAPVRVACLGPEGTFCHQAARARFGAQADFAPVATIADIVSSVERERASFGVVPVENTTEGVVTETLDRLASTELLACGEIVLRVSHQLLSRSGRREDVRRIASHPQPLAQCREWLDRELPGLERIETASTTAAAQLATEDPSVAAIASVLAGQVYDLSTVEESIEDRRDNTTRFLVLGHELAAPSGNDLTSAVFTARKDEAGALYRLLEPFARHGVNLTAIHIRPIKGKPWEYLFFVDMEGHCRDAAVVRALAEAAERAFSHRVVGSFARATARPRPEAGEDAS